MKGYEMVVGLEVHVELKTRTKIFCSCPTSFGAEPNTQCCPVCMGMPGTLPVLNRQVVDYAVRAGLATHCTIAAYSKQDRKNYFYPDLPKAYQISQYDLPLCEHGYLDIEREEGVKRIGITRIHIEEDAGKLVHVEGGGTLIDCNRCGVPLIEIVSEPDIRSAGEAIRYLQKLRAIILYTGISDCKMNEGSFRCDVNLSVRRPGQPLGTRTEMKNLNSFQSIQRAIEYEYQRQVDALEAGEAIVQETRRFDQATGKTSAMRSKEDANDYRYFPDPDLPPIELGEREIQSIRAQIPALPDARKAQYVSHFGLTPLDAERIAQRREVADAFERAAQAAEQPKLLVNLLLELVKELPQEEAPVPVEPAHLAELANLLSQGRINSGAAKLLVKRLAEKDQPPEQLVQALGLYQISDQEALSTLVMRTLKENADLADKYRQGKRSAIQALMGRAMSSAGGRANPELLQQLMKRALES